MSPAQWFLVGLALGGGVGFGLGYVRGMHKMFIDVVTRRFHLREAQRGMTRAIRAKTLVKTIDQFAPTTVADGGCAHCGYPVGADELYCTPMCELCDRDMLAAVAINGRRDMCDGRCMLEDEGAEP